MKSEEEIRERLNKAEQKRGEILERRRLRKKWTHSEYYKNRTRILELEWVLGE